MYIKYLKNYFEKQKFHPSFEEWNFVLFVLFLVCFVVNQFQQNTYKTAVSSVFH